MTWRTRVGTSAVSIAALAGVGASISMAASTATVTTASVTRYTTGVTNVRAGTSTSTAVVGSLSAGTKVTGALQSNGWIKIATPTTYAGKYVSDSVLSSTDLAAPKSEPTSGHVTGWIRGDYEVVVNVRSGAGMTFPVVKTLPKQTQVTGDLAKGWLHTSSGYINAAEVEFLSSNISVVNGFMNSSDLCVIPAAYNSPEVFAVTSPASHKRYAYDATTSRSLNCAALPNLVALEKAYTAAMGHPATIDLAYRSADEQAAWLNNPAVSASPVGKSNHGWGLAVDFRDNGKNGAANEFSKDGAGFAWLTKNAGRYGFAVDPVVTTREGAWQSETFHWNFIG